MPESEFSYHLKSLDISVRSTFVGKNLKKIVFQHDSEKERASHKGLIPKHVTTFHNQLKAFDSGLRKHFDVSIHFNASEFQIAVWDKIREIPYGNTISYGKLAAQLGDVKKVRAVASAIAKNPVPIVVPCHRVVGAHGELRGYVGGLKLKKQLIQLEKARLDR